MPKKMSPLRANSSNTLFINPPLSKIKEIVGGKAQPMSKKI